jgi:Fe-S cluster assembly protein SufD
MTTYQDVVEKQNVSNDDFRQEAKDKLSFDTSKNEAWNFFSAQEFFPSNVEEKRNSSLNSLSEYYQKNPDDISLGREENPFSFANTVLFTEGNLITLSGKNNDPITIDLSTTDHHRLHIVSRVNSEATIILRINSETSLSFLNTFTSITLEDNSNLTVFVISDSVEATHIDHIDIKQGKESQFKILFFEKNPLKSKRHLFHTFNGEFSKAEFYGVSLLSGSSKSGTQLWINHAVKNCESVQLFKSVLTDKSFSEFTGLVSVEEGCHVTDSKQLNQSLLLSDHARVISRPQLRIDADDVLCAHGSTIGQLNPDEVFYIRSRGLSETEAKSLLTIGFIGEVLEQVTLSSLRDELLRAVKKEVARYA